MTPTFRGVKLSKGYSRLDKIGPKKGTHNEKWKLLVNVDINPERWMY